MYFQPYGDDQQLNLNWIINEIINLHKQLDPDYETPSFTQVYPYSNLNRLNLDWILSELKALKELAPEPTPSIDIQAVAKALVALPFDSTKAYQIYDFISRDGEIWRATEAIAAGGEWDSSKWFKTKIGTDLSVLERWINTINNSLTSEIQARQDADTALQNRINGLTSANISDDSDAGGTNVKASLNALKGSINSLNNAVGISQLSDLSLTANHFIQFLSNVSVGGITIPRHSRGVLVSSTGSDAALYAIDTNGNFYVSYRNSGTWTNAKNMTADITVLNGAINAITPLDTAPTQNSTKGITSDAVYKKTTEQIIYQDNGSYTNNIGTNLNLTEAVEGHSFLKVVTFLNSVASSTRIILLYPIGAGACYLPAPVSADYNYVRCEAYNKIFSIISSSHATLYVKSISLIL